MAVRTNSIGGIPAQDVARLLGIFERHPEVTRVLLYGSRALGTYARGSDIDLCIADSEIGLSGELAIEREIDDLLLPYTVDLSVYDKIENESLREHIDRAGITIYMRQQPHRLEGATD